jgi:hypothetical protein
MGEVNCTYVKVLAWLANINHAWLILTNVMYTTLLTGFTGFTANL